MTDIRRCVAAAMVLAFVFLAGCASQETPYVSRDALVDAARRELLGALTASDPVIRTHAVEAMRESLGSGARREIVGATGDLEPIVRFAALMAAGELRLGEVRARAQQLLSDEDPHVQIGAIFALHRLGDVRYSSGLEVALTSPNPLVRGNAAFALGRLGEPSATRILRPALKDRAPEVRLQVAEALWRLGDEEGLRALVAVASLVSHPDRRVVALLALAGPRDPRVSDHIRGALGSDDPDVQLVAARALGMLGSDEGYPMALRGASGGEAPRRYRAALALGAIGKADALSALAALLRDSDPDVRLAAATAVLQLR